MIELLDKIRAIDPEAADYLKTVVIPRWPNKKLKEPDDLCCFFLWELTPQKAPYWRNIYLKLNEQENE
jgi:hypothetical protein